MPDGLLADGRGLATSRWSVPAPRFQLVDADIPKDGYLVARYRPSGRGRDPRILGLRAAGPADSLRPWTRTGIPAPAARDRKVPITVAPVGLVLFAARRRMFPPRARALGIAACVLLVLNPLSTLLFGVTVGRLYESGRSPFAIIVGFSALSTSSARRPSPC
jgi:hypothetical protein